MRGEKVKIHIYANNQNTTATWYLNEIETTGIYVCTLNDIADFQRLTFWNFSNVRIEFKDGRIKEKMFYYDSIRNRLTQVDSDRLDFWVKEDNKESEGKSMLHKVTVTKTEEKVLEEYWCARGVKENIVTNAKSVIGEMKCTKEPTLNEIAVFLENSGADFVSVEHNYRFEQDLPFC